MRNSPVIARSTYLHPKVALSRYQSIIDDPSSGEIDYDSVEPSATKPTNGAIRVNDLLETITGTTLFNISPKCPES